MNTLAILLLLATAAATLAALVDTALRWASAFAHLSRELAR